MSVQFPHDKRIFKFFVEFLDMLGKSTYCLPNYDILIQKTYFAYKIMLFIMTAQRKGVLLCLLHSLHIQML